MLKIMTGDTPVMVINEIVPSAGINLGVAALHQKTITPDAQAQRVGDKVTPIAAGGGGVHPLDIFPRGNIVPASKVRLTRLGGNAVGTSGRIDSAQRDSEPAGITAAIWRLGARVFLSEQITDHFTGCEEKHHGEKCREYSNTLKGYLELFSHFEGTAYSCS